MNSIITQSRTAFFVILTFTGCAGCTSHPGDVDIWSAVANNDTAAIDRYVAAGGDLNVRAKSGAYPLFMALKDGNRESYLKLLDAGADPNLLFGRHPGRLSVVHYAATLPDSFWLCTALKKGGDPNLKNEWPENAFLGFPLDYAVTENQMGNVKCLVEHGAKLDVLDPFGRGPLRAAMYLPNFSMVMYLLESGADYKLSDPNHEGNSFLFIVRSLKPNLYKSPDREQVIEIRNWLRQRGVQIDASGE